MNTREAEAVALGAAWDFRAGIRALSTNLVANLVEVRTRVKALHQRRGSVWRRYGDRFDEASVSRATFPWRQIRSFKDFFYMKKSEPWRGIPAVNGDVYRTAVDLDHSAVNTSLVVAVAGVDPRWCHSFSRIDHPCRKTILCHHEGGKHGDREYESADHYG